MSAVRPISARDPEETLLDVIGSLVGDDPARKVDMLTQMAFIAQSPLIHAYEQSMKQVRATAVECLLDGKDYRNKTGLVVDKAAVHAFIKGIDAAFATFNRLAEYAKNRPVKEQGA